MGTGYAIRLSPAVGGTSWVRPDGALSGVPVFQDVAAWGTMTVAGLVENTQYTIRCTARNGDGVETAPGPGATITTLGPPDGIPLGAGTHWMLLE